MVRMHRWFFFLVWHFFDPVVTRSDSFAQNNYMLNKRQHARVRGEAPALAAAFCFLPPLQLRRQNGIPFGEMGMLLGYAEAFHRNMLIKRFRRFQPCEMFAKAA